MSAPRSFFRRRLEALGRARALGTGDSAHEYLVDQANLRGFHGAASSRIDLGEIDPDLSLEDIVVGLLQPQAPAEARIVKLVVRILQAGVSSPDRLVFRSHRERASSNLAWVLEQIPEAEWTSGLEAVADALRKRPPRTVARPEIRYASARLLRRPAGR